MPLRIPSNKQERHRRLTIPIFDRAAGKQLKDDGLVVFQASRLREYTSSASVPRTDCSESAVRLRSCLAGSFFLGLVGGFHDHEFVSTFVYDFDRDLLVLA